MKRKLVKHGESTLMISIPAKWAKENNLKRGEEVEIEEKGNKITISQSFKKQKKETEINISSLTESSIRTILTNLYRLGYQKIKINFEKQKAAKVIEKTVQNNLIGFEVIKTNDTSAEIENITEPSTDQFNNIFSKILLNIDALFEITKENLKNKKKDGELTEKQIQSFDNFCRRVLSQNNTAKDHLKWAFHSELIHAQRELYLANKFIINNKTSNRKEVENCLNNSKEIFHLLKQAYKSKDIKLLEKIHEKEKDFIYKKGYTSIKKTGSPEIYHILNSTRNFYLASSPLFGLFISNPPTHT